MALQSLPARNLATTTKSVPFWDGITPRWLLKLLPWVQVNSGTYRVNRVSAEAEVLSHHEEGAPLPVDFFDYDVEPAEYTLSTVQTVLKVHTRVTDLYNDPHDQLKQQLRLTLEAVREEQERLAVGSQEFGLLKVCTDGQRTATLAGPPTPDDFDRLLSMVWKKPSFFLAHPAAIAAFGRECTARGIALPAYPLLHTSFIAWRGVPIVPCDKVLVDGESRKRSGTTSVLLLRVGEEEQGVVGLHQAGLHAEQIPSLSVRFKGIDDHSIATYLVTLYFSIAVTTDDALAVLENVKV